MIYSTNKLTCTIYDIGVLQLHEYTIIRGNLKNLVITSIWKWLSHNSIQERKSNVISTF